MRNRQFLITAFVFLPLFFGSGPADAAVGQWTLIGPQPLIAPRVQHSGWINAIAVDPRAANVAYLGAVGGGVWKTTDGGQTWTPLTDDQPSLEIGALALDPTNPGIIYAGTTFSNALFGNLGAGILKSTDGGSTWAQLPGPLPTGSGLEAAVKWLAVSPSDGNVVLALDASTEGAAVYRSADGGNTWKQVLASSTVYGGQVLFDPSNGTIAYATLGGVYKSADGGNTWAAANGTAANALPAGTYLGLAIAPSTPQTLYVDLIDSASVQMFKSVDGAQNWSPLPGSPQCEGIQVDPVNPNIVFAGYFDLFLSTDGGSSWNFFDTGTSGIQTAIAFSADGSILYLGSEFGAWKVSGWNGNPTSTDLNATLAITDFYGIAMHPTDPTKAIGGAQSNGMDLYSGALPWNLVACDNGGEAAFDFLNPSTVYATCTPAPGILKSIDGGSTFSPSQNGIDANEFQPGVLPALAMDPADPQRLYVAAGHVWQSTDGAATWTAISAVLGPGVGIWQSLAISPSNPNTVYLANSNGVYVTANASQGSGATWSSISDGLAQCGTVGPNCAYLTRIAVDFSNASTAYVTVASYGRGHVLKTTNQGASWTDISGNLPNLRVNDIAIDPDVPDTLYIATERGVYSTADGGNTWSSLGTGLPNVTVTALKLQRPTRILRAATFGRSAWDLQLGAVASPVSLSSISLSFTASGSKTVTLTNTGTAPLTLYSITAPDGFSQTNTCGVRVLGGGNCVITVSFAPATTGSFSGSITITDDAPGGPQAISVSGTGTATPDFSLGMASGAPSSATVTAGQTASYALTVTPLGGLNQSVSLSCSGAPSLATCSVSPSSIALDGKNPGSITVSVATTAPSVVLHGPLSPPVEWAPVRAPWFWAMILMLSCVLLVFGLRGKGQWLQTASKVAMGITIIAAMFWVACGGGSGGGGGGGGGGNPGTPSGTYSLTVTGTSTSGSTTLTHNFALTLTVD